MSEPEVEVEDFAAMFEASVKTRRFTRGQTIEGTIVAIGPDTSLVNVGGILLCVIGLWLINQK